MADYLTRLLTVDPEPDRPVALGAYLTAWNPTTGENTVSVGATNYTNLPAIRPTITGTGPVLILFTPEPVLIGTVTPATPAG